MDTVQTLGAALGFGLLSGLRLYLTVLLIGLAQRFEWLPLEGHLTGLRILADDRVLWAAGAATVLEFLADKIPWVDSLWDTVHTFIRPIGAALLGSAAAADLAPQWRIVIALLAGGVALGGHSTKAATRLAVNHSPEPFSNIALSTLGDMAVPLGVWFTFRYPKLALAFALLFTAVFLWLAPKLFRAIRLEVVIAAALFAKWFGGDVREPAEVPEDLRVAASNQALPVLKGWRCAASRSAGGLSRSLGWLCVNPTHLVFVTRRLFRRRVHGIERRTIRSVTFRRGFILSSLIVDAGGVEQRFDLLPGTPRDLAERLQAVVAARA
jgi:hypothetical protein